MSIIFKSKLIRLKSSKQDEHNGHIMTGKGKIDFRKEVLECDAAIKGYHVSFGSSHEHPISTIGAYIDNVEKVGEYVNFEVGVELAMKSDSADLDGWIEVLVIASC